MNKHQSSTGVAEPVHESAPLAQWVAERLCRTDPRTGDNCSWYHGFRQYLRALGLAITPAHHADFLRTCMGSSVHPGQVVRVLVSGAIDYSMLAHVWWACGQWQATAEVTVVDVCDTPLFLNLWYARRMGIGVRTMRADILEFAPPERFDVICTNSFLGQFPPDQRPQLLTRWHDLLEPGGRVFTVTPVRPGTGAAAIGFTVAEAEALQDAVRRCARKLPGHCRYDEAEILRLAHAFTQRMRVYPVRSLQEIQTLFESGGFSLEKLLKSPIEDENHTLTGPTVSRGVEYAMVAAQRPWP